jgi:hypothetical protein
MSTRSSLWIQLIHCLPLPSGPPAHHTKLHNYYQQTHDARCSVRQQKSCLLVVPTNMYHVVVYRHKGSLCELGDAMEWTGEHHP